MAPHTEFDFSALEYRTLSPAQRGAVVQTVICQARVARAAELASLSRATMRGPARIVVAGWRAARWLAGSAAAIVSEAWRRHQERRRRRIATARLYAMDDRALWDIGLSRGDIEFAVNGGIDPTRRRCPASRRRQFVSADCADPALPSPRQRLPLPLVLRKSCAG
jgi:uncharacterized protein YjiS (DUF1127 family)